MKEMSSGGGSILPRNKYWQGMASTVSGIGGPDMSNPKLLDMSADHQVLDIPTTPSGDVRDNNSCTIRFGSFVSPHILTAPPPFFISLYSFALKFYY